MAIKTSYYDGETYSAADDVRQWEKLISSGVWTKESGDFLVVANSPNDLSVNVAPGTAQKNGYFIQSDAIVNLSVNSNTSGSNRIDIVVLDVTSNPTVLSVIQGTPSGSPTPPIPNSKQLKLAEIFVGNNVSVISSGNITDARIAATIPGSDAERFGGQLPAYYLNYLNLTNKPTFFRADAVSVTSSRNLALTDANKRLFVNSASAVTVTIPLNSSVAFTVGDEIEIVGIGDGTVSIAAAGGVTINSKDSNKVIAGKYAAVSLLKTGTNEWLLIGALTS